MSYSPLRPYKDDFDNAVYNVGKGKYITTFCNIEDTDEFINYVANTYIFNIEVKSVMSRTVDFITFRCSISRLCKFNDNIYKVDDVICTCWIKSKYLKFSSGGYLYKDWCNVFYPKLNENNGLKSRIFSESHFAYIVLKAYREFDNV